MAFRIVEETLSIPFQDMSFETGTWSDVFSAGIAYKNKTTAAETTTVHIPLDMPRRTDVQGVKLKKIDLHLRVGAANLSSAPTCTLYRQNFLSTAAADTDITASSVAVTHNGVVTFDANDRLLTVTVDSPSFDLTTQASCAYMLDVALPCAASSTLRVYKALATFEVLT